MIENNPLVSICLPNLNSGLFIQDRIKSIIEQTYKNWELIVNDSYSNDGSWEFLEALKIENKRVSKIQTPREGPYRAWNNCIARSRGKYIYIATSDDTMAANCIEKLVDALDDNKDCYTAHCPLIIIDENGKKAYGKKWPECTLFSVDNKELVNKKHIRKAPYDGLLHLTGQHLIHSITQLLIRRSLFSKIGMFSSRWGSVGDFNWEMKAGLIGNMIHVPSTWATWRIHPNQATAAVNMFSPDRDPKTEEMIEDAMDLCMQYLPEKVVQGLKIHWLNWSREMREYYAGLRKRPSILRRRIYQFNMLINGTKSVRKEITRRILGEKKWPEEMPNSVKCWLESLGLGKLIKII